MKLNDFTLEHFKALPLVTEGESKEVRYLGNGEVIIALKPTIYSYTHNRSGVIPGTDILRLKSIAALLPILREAGIQHTYKEITDRWIRSQLVLQPVVQGTPAPFRPNDLTKEELATLPVAPPIEVVAKTVHSGTPKHRYYAMTEHTTINGWPIRADKPYPQPFIRFDWRNPTHDLSDNRLADEVLPEPMAKWFINVSEAQKTAMTAFMTLQQYFKNKGLDLWDICFFIAADGKKMFGEVSPDCLRVRATDGSALDKDIWRHGGSSDAVVKKWQAFVNLLKND